MFFGVFLGPILTLVLFNTVIFVLVIRVLFRKSTKKIVDIDKKAQVQKTLKMLFGIISIMFIFGIQWLFGAFTIAKASTVFQWLFVIFSTLQGSYLFLFFVALSPKAREEWINAFSFGYRKIASYTSQQSFYTGSTYITPKSANNSLNRLVSNDGKVSDIEMKKKTLMALPTSISEDKKTEFVIENNTPADVSSIPKIEEADIDEKKSLQSEEDVDTSENSVTKCPDFSKTEFGDD